MKNEYFLFFEEDDLFLLFSRIIEIIEREINYFFNITGWRIAPGIVFTTPRSVILGVLFKAPYTTVYHTLFESASTVSKGTKFKAPGF